MVVGEALPETLLIISSNFFLSSNFKHAPHDQIKLKINIHSMVSASVLMSSSTYPSELNNNESSRLHNCYIIFKLVLLIVCSKGYPILSSNTPSNIKLMVATTYFKNNSFKVSIKISLVSFFSGHLSNIHLKKYGS